MLEISKYIYGYDNVFPKAMERLFEMRGYSYKTPIYSTGGYVSTVLEDVDGRKVAFKHYISKEELERARPRAVKRTFDLSIDPEGNLYENWHHHNLKVVFNNSFHDRYFIIDDKEVYHCGTSINRIGYKTFSINLINDEEICNLLINKVNKIV